jgi:hypothetical protein
LKDNKITPIDGEPTLQTLTKAHSELRNAYNFGSLYLVKLETVYNTISNIPYVAPFDPGKTPNLVNFYSTAVETAKIE